MVFKGAGRRGFIKICRISVKVITLKGYVRSGSREGIPFHPWLLKGSSQRIAGQLLAS